MGSSLDGGELPRPELLGNIQDIYTTREFSFVWIETERRDGGRLSGKRGKPRGQGEDEGQGEGGDGGEDDDAYLI